MSTDGSALGYAELLRLAASKGLLELDSTIVQIPSEQNRGHAVVIASVRTASALFRSIGEAWWDGGQPGREHALVLAEVRAKTRALCEAVGMPQPVQGATSAGRGSPPPAGAQPSARPAEPPVAAGAPQPQEARVTDSAAAAPRGDARDAVPSAASSRASAPERATLAGASAAEPRPVAAPEPGEASPAPRADDAAATAAVRSRAQSVRAAPRAAMPPGEGLGPDILQKLLQMTRRIGELKHDELTEEAALAKLDSFFQRAFSHPLAEGTRMEGQRVVQRLAADLAKLSQEQGDADGYVAS